MGNRGSGQKYKICKATTNNKTGDNYSITVPRFIAQKFNEVYFKLDVSGNCLIFESGCKIRIGDIEIQNPHDRLFVGGGTVIFK